MKEEKIAQISIDQDRCSRCGRCARVCPSVVFGVGENDKTVSVLRPSSCIQCGHCVDVCTTDALSHGAFPQEKIHRIDQDLLPTADSLMELLRSRRSNRTITDKPIPASVLTDMLEAARYAPTAENSRLVKVTVLDQSEDLQAVEDKVMRFFLLMARLLMNPVVRPFTKVLLPDLYAEAPELMRFEKRWKAGEKPCLCNATALLVFSAPAGYDFGWQDCNLSYQNASLMGQAHGVSQVYMGLVQTALKYMGKGSVARLLKLPCGHRPYALMAVGMPAFQYPKYTER